MKRTILVGLLGFLCLPLAGLCARSFADDKEPCTIANKGDSPVARACTKGGRPEAAKTMKAAVKAAKSHGVVFRCDGCHEDTDGYALKKNAKDDFKKLMAATQGK